MNRILGLQRMRLATDSPGHLAQSSSSCDHHSCSYECNS